MSNARPLRTVFFVMGLLSILGLVNFSSVLLAQDSPPPAGAEEKPSKPIRELIEVESKDAVKAPKSVPAERIRAAIERVKAELDAQRQRHRAESAALNARLEAARESVSELLQQKQQKLRRLAELNKQKTELAETLYESETKTDDAELTSTSFDSEIQRLAVDFRDRHAKTLQALANPNFLENIDALAEEDHPDPQTERLTQLLDRFTAGIDASETVETFTTDVSVSVEEGQPGQVLPTSVLRVGYLAAYYWNETAGEAGIITPRESDEHLDGQSDLPEYQRAAIRDLVENPGEGGLVPFDVSGGAGLATLSIKDDLKTWFAKGGSFMWPLLIVAILAFIVVLERTLVLTLRGQGMDRRISRVLAAAEKGDLAEAEARARRSSGAVRRVFTAALENRDRGRSVIEDVTQEQLLHETPKFEARLAFIALCAAVSPLMGLLGTVTGMIATFQAVTIFGTSDPRNMAGGISVALITTQGGLYLAIPCLLARGILGSVAGGAINRLEVGAMSLVIAILKFQPRADGPGLVGETSSPSPTTDRHAGTDNILSDGEGVPSRLSDMFDDVEEKAVTVKKDPSLDADDLDLDDIEVGDVDDDPSERS